MSRAIVVRGDARRLPLPDESVDLMVTSPPFFGLRAYEDNGRAYVGQVGAEPSPTAYVAALVECTREWLRVLKQSGSLFVDLGDKYDVPRKSLMLLPERYRIACVDELGLVARAVLVWAKPNPLPDSATDRVRRTHEEWVHLTKRPDFFCALDAIRVPHVATATGRDTSGWKAGPSGNREIRRGAWSGATVRDFATNPLGKVPGSVWEIPPEPLRVPDDLGVKHFAAFPTEWPRRLILGWSPPDGVVLDPFGGTGTTALVAAALGRVGITIDLSFDYSRIARWRTTDPAQRARAMRVKPQPAEPPDQGDLLDGMLA